MFTVHMLVTQLSSACSLDGSGETSSLDDYYEATLALLTAGGDDGRETWIFVVDIDALYRLERDACCLRSALADGDSDLFLMGMLETWTSGVRVVVGLSLTLEGLASLTGVAVPLAHPVHLKKLPE